MVVRLQSDKNKKPFRKSEWITVWKTKDGGYSLGATYPTYGDANRYRDTTDFAGVLEIPYEVIE